MQACLAELIRERVSCLAHEHDDLFLELLVLQAKCVFGVDTFGVDVLEHTDEARLCGFGDPLCGIQAWDREVGLSDEFAQAFLHDVAEIAVIDRPRVLFDGWTVAW